MGLEREREKEGGREGERETCACWRQVNVPCAFAWQWQFTHIPPSSCRHLLLSPSSSLPSHMGYLVHLTWPFGQLDCDLTPLLRQMGAWHRAANLPVWWSVKYAMPTAQSTNLLKLHAANRKTNTPSNCACVCVCQCACVCVPEQPQLTVQSWWVDARRLNSFSRLQIGLLVELKMRSALSS